MHPVILYFIILGRGAPYSDLFFVKRYHFDHSCVKQFKEILESAYPDPNINQLLLSILIFWIKN